MKITILGCGVAGGVPMISAGWGRCDPGNPKNRRRRQSILVEAEGQTILVDTSPDLREQLLDTRTRHLDAVLYTHAHADHLHGIDDLREVNRVMRAPIPVYAELGTLAEIADRFSYVFTPMNMETETLYKPWLEPHRIDGPFQVGPLTVVPFDQDHGYSRTTGFRFGTAAYSTDVLDLPEASFAHLLGLDVWIVGCLIDQPHNTHAHVEKALTWVDRIKPKLTVITHMSPRLDYASLVATLPAGVVPAYDGMVLEVP
jgi:phosphoribosyl 1,2-cyclic phosphate phosphodiesterase